MKQQTKTKSNKPKLRRAEEIRLYKFMQTYVLGKNYEKDDLLSIPINSPK